VDHVLNRDILPPLKKLGRNVFASLCNQIIWICLK